MQTQTIKLLAISFTTLLSSACFATTDNMFIERYNTQLSACYDNSMLGSDSDIDTNESIKPCKKVLHATLSTQNNKAMASHNLALIYYNAGDLSNAKKYAIESISYKSGLASSHILLAQVYYLQRELQLAADAYERSLELDSTNLHVAKNLKAINSKLVALAAK